MSILDKVAAARAKAIVILDKAAELFKGEPLRALGYGVAAAIFAAALVFDKIPDMTFAEAIVTATSVLTAIAGFVETARNLVYSLPTVERIAAQAAATGDATVPPPPATEVGAGS